MVMTLDEVTHAAKAIARAEGVTVSSVCVASTDPGTSRVELLVNINPEAGSASLVVNLSRDEPGRFRDELCDALRLRRVR